MNEDQIARNMSSKLCVIKHNKKPFETYEDIQKQYPGMKVTELCYKCRKIYKVPDIFMDTNMPVCGPCYKIHFANTYKG